MFNASSLALENSDSLSSIAMSTEVESPFFKIVARKSTAPASSRQILFLSLSSVIDLSLRRLLSCKCGNFLASLRSLAIWALSMGGFGVGIRSIPKEALRVHHAWINRRRVWFGVRSLPNNSCFVTGQVLFLHENNHLSMFYLS
jgi:hypothetical protein